MFPEDSAKCEIVNTWCGRPHDCHTCPALPEALKAHGIRLGWWVCPGCMANADGLVSSLGPVMIMGLYTSGDCQNPQCNRDDRYSIVLQLVCPA